MNTVMNYMYRDGSNYKDYTSVVLEGEITEEGRKTIRKVLDGGELFIPEQVGLPANRLDQYERCEDDHAYCELDPDEGFEFTNAEPTVPMTVADLVKAFATVTAWDESLVACGG